MKESLVSIVVPIYNVEQYLEECIDSLLHQTYSNIEIILIDDGSTDNSLKICSKYYNNSKIKVIKQENQGVSVARNTGLQNAKGEYIAFVDPDDIVSENYIEIMLKNIEKYQCDLLYCKYTNDYEKINKKLTSKRQIKKASYVYEKILKNQGIDGYVWNKLFKMSIIKKYRIKFEEGITIWEDLKFIINYIYRCNKIIFINDILYYYRVRDNSAVNNSKASQKKAEDKVTVCQKLLLEDHKQNVIYTKALKKIYKNVLVEYIYQLLVNNKRISPQYEEKIKKIYKDIFGLSFKNIVKLKYIIKSR